MRFIPFLLVLALLFYSCNDNNQKRDKAEKLIVENMDTAGVLDYMIIQSEIQEDKAILQLSRILDCSPYTIIRLKERDTYPTVYAQNNILSLAKDVFVDKSTLEDRDPKSNTTIKLFHFFKKHYIFGSIIALCISIIVFYHFKNVVGRCTIPITKTTQESVDRKLLGITIGTKVKKDIRVIGYKKDFRILYRTIAVYAIVLICLIAWWAYRYEHRNNIDVIDNYKIVYDPIWETEL